MKTRFFDPPRPRFFAHRGRSATYPENTLPAFEAAMALGIVYLELDVWASRDGQVVVHHDETLQRTCGDPRRVSDVRGEELAALDAGHGFTQDGRIFPFRGQGIGIPSLEEVLRRYPEAMVTVEIKQEEPPIEELVMEVVRKTGSEERVLLASENTVILKRARAVCGGIPTNMGQGEVAEFIHWVQRGCPAGYRPPGAALQIPEEYGPVRLVTETTLKAAHGAGLEIHVWTVNRPEDMRRLLDLGVDGLMTDYPELLIKAGG